ncbi:MAG TPA: helix-turn-helix transcriptional regulator [Longimicrobium sp.]|nr:helix-turn-helix transcriptional regulator [Longimicrobium sp.]
MTAKEVRALRAARGWTVEQLADDVHAIPLEISAWEAGAVEVTPFAAARIRWHLETDRWSAALDAALRENPPCAWVRTNLPHLQERVFVDSAGLAWAESGAEFREHFAGCPYCRARWQAAEAVGFPPREPDEESIARRARFEAWLEFLPRWARRPVVAVLELADVALAALLVATIPARDSGLPARITGLGMGALVGFVALRLTRAGLGGLAERHPYLAGLLAGAAASVSGVLMWRMYDASVQRSDPRVWLGAAAVATALGLITGARARREAAAAEPVAPREVGGPGARPALRNPELDLPEREAAKVPTIILRRT